MRGVQRQRIYDSEIRASKRFDSVGEMQAYCDHLTASAWWRKNIRSPSRIVVHDGRGRRNACGYRDLYGVGHVKMPKWSRSEVVLLHEIAHTIHSDGNDHGPRWTGVFLGLLAKRIGHDHAERQMHAFREHRTASGRAAPVHWKLPKWYPAKPRARRSRAPSDALATA